MRKTCGCAVLLVFAISITGARATDPQIPIETVVVTGEAASRQNLIDRKVYPVAHDVQASFGSAADILNNIPSVTVDSDGNVSLRNDSNVTILIDGKPSAQFSGSTGGTSLQELPASEIDRIEIMTSPPASLRAAGSGGVINIITKKHRLAGFSGILRASAGTDGRFVTNADLTYNAGPIRSSLGIGLREDVRDRLITDTRLVNGAATDVSTVSGQRLHEIIRRLVPSAKASLDYTIDPDQTVGTSFSYRNLIGTRNFVQLDQSGPLSDAIDDLSHRISTGREWDTYIDESIHYDRTIDATQSLSFYLTRSTKREDENYNYENTFQRPISTPTFDALHLGLDLTEVDVSADYERSFAFGGKLKLGVELDSNHNLFDNSGANVVDGVAIPNPIVTNAFRYRNHSNSLYGEFDVPLGSWHLDAGLRYENNHAATLLITGNVPGHNTDNGFYPSAHLKRSFDDGWDVFVSLSRRITRPDPEALNPFVDYQDTHNLRAGNADLLPQDTWLYELGYNHAGAHVNFSTTVYYRFDRNSITDVVEPVDADVVLIRKENLPKTHSIGIEFETDGKITERLGYSISANAFSLQIDARTLGAAGLQSTQGINFKAEVNYRFSADDYFQTTFSRVAGRLTPQGSLGPVDVLNVGFKHKIDQDITLVASVADLLNGQGLHRVISTPQLQDNYLRLPHGQIAFIGIVYGLGGAPEKKIDDFTYEQ